MPLSRRTSFAAACLSSMAFSKSALATFARNLSPIARGRGRMKHGQGVRLDGVQIYADAARWPHSGVVNLAMEGATVERHDGRSCKTEVVDGSNSTSATKAAVEPLLTSCIQAGALPSPPPSSQNHTKHNSYAEALSSQTTPE
ncbi:hypothetical protein EDD15DRAFT_2519400, partial [Pisolithus albus]